MQLVASTPMEICKRMPVSEPRMRMGPGEDDESRRCWSPSEVFSMEMRSGREEWRREVEEECKKGVAALRETKTKINE